MKPKWRTFCISDKKFAMTFIPFCGNHVKWRLVGLNPSTRICLLLLPFWKRNQRMYVLIRCWCILSSPVKSRFVESHRQQMGLFTSIHIWRISMFYTCTTTFIIVCIPEFAICPMKCMDTITLYFALLWLHHHQLWMFKRQTVFRILEMYSRTYVWVFTCYSNLFISFDGTKAKVTERVSAAVKRVS